MVEWDAIHYSWQLQRSQREHLEGVDDNLLRGTYYNAAMTMGYVDLLSNSSKSCYGIGAGITKANNYNLPIVEELRPSISPQQPKLDRSPFSRRFKT